MRPRPDFFQGRFPGGCQGLGRPGVEGISIGSSVCATNPELSVSMHCAEFRPAQHRARRALLASFTAEMEAAGGFEPPHRGFADLSLNHLGTPPCLTSNTAVLELSTVAGERQS
jgi:hypothetical protein